MSHFLLVDFGTTSTKSALVDLDSGHFRDLRRHPALPADTSAGRHEVSLAAIQQRFEDLCVDAWAASDDGFEGICLCSEMHGFALLEPETGRPLTEYVSWLDQRALEEVDGVRTFDRVADALGDDFRRLTGMRPRPGFPLINLVHCARTMELPRQVRIVSLPGWLAGGGALVAEHPTILGGMALADVATRHLSPQLLETATELGGVRVETGAVAADDTVAGHWQGPGGRVPIYVGVGDHQCSVLGAGVIDAATVSINLGTGSQVAVVGPPPSHHFEHRPYFDGQDLTAVTHIPAGRALSEFVGFVRSVLELAGAGAADAWTMLADVTPDDVDGSTLHVDLAVFEGARGFDDGGRIGAILEGQLTPQNYLASVLRAFATQYIEVLELFDLEPAATIALGGGIARNLPHLATVLTRGSGRTVEAASELDESLIGLRALALRCGGRAPTVAQAWRLHGRACEVIDD